MTTPAKLRLSMAVMLGTAALGSLASVQAATDTDNLTVTATVAAVCQIDSVTTLDFGSISPLSQANYDAQADINWRCTSGTTADIDLDGGSSGNINARAMQGASESLPYQLYTDAARSQVWGDGTTGDDVDVNGTGMGASSVRTVYGRVVDADVLGLGPDTYSDTVVVTINF